MASRISVKITGADNIQVGLRTLARALPGIANDDVENAMELARHEASGWWGGGNSYAVPERSGQAYVRTGAYGSGTYVEQDGASFRLMGEAAHTRVVGGDADGRGQAWMHVGRWPVRAVVVRRYAETLTGDIDNRIQESAEAFGL